MPEVDVTDVPRLREAGALLIDVREAHEWRSGHAHGAINSPLRCLAFQIHVLPRDRDILFICTSGNRSGVAAMLARRAGIKRSWNVRGGMLSWMAAGLPLE